MTAHYPLTTTKILLGQYDISGDLNKIEIDRSQAELADDTFTSAATGFRARIPGMQDGVFSLAGMVELTDDGQDEIFETNMSLSSIPIMVGLQGFTDFNRVKFGLIQQGEYKSGGNIGGRAEFSANGRISNYVLTDGNILATGAKTGTFNGTARQLGAVSASRSIWAQIHAVAKTTFTSAVFKLQSDDNSGFSSPTDRITFTTITGLTSELKTLAGAITDDYWRIVCSSFTGTSLTIYCAVGIQ